MESISRGTLISKQAVIFDPTSQIPLREAISPRLHSILPRQVLFASPSLFRLAKCGSPREVPFASGSVVRLVKCRSPHEVQFASRSAVRLAKCGSPREVRFTSRSGVCLAFIYFYVSHHL
ncbi:hypothetical protein ACLB2K_006043 [Fragaria x ananassa]